MDEGSSGAAAERGGAAVLMAPAELIARADDGRLRVVDASFELTRPEVGSRTYAAGHVPGAVHLDLDRDLAAAPGAAGRHPLPDVGELARRLGDLGIGREHEVVIYDQSGTMYAARAWWLLRYLGHPNVRFLDGGTAAYLAAGGELTTEVPLHSPTTFVASPRGAMIVTADEVLARLEDPSLVLLDARAPERYRGEVEPFDPVAGHVPGALNRPMGLSLGDGGLLPPAALAAALGVAGLAPDAELAAYCGSGVAAAHLVLALEVAGRPGARLYPGSWSEWSRRGDLPIAHGAEPVAT